MLQTPFMGGIAIATAQPRCVGEALAQTGVVLAQLGDLLQKLLLLGGELLPLGRHSCGV
jgi:hypothetical protein